MADTPKAEKRELYDQAQRKLLATILADPSCTTRILELINEDDVEEPSYALIFAAMAELNRQDREITVISVGELLERRGELKKAGGLTTLYTMLKEAEDAFRLDAGPEVYARIVKQSSAKAKISRLVKENEEFFKDDSGVQVVEAVSQLQNELNSQLLTLSDDATITRLNREFHEYDRVLSERKKITEENGDQAEGLTGIPSLLPSINKYTRGWAPGQLITVGAGTGMGKALALDTPIRVPGGFKNMGDLSVGEKVYGRDGKLTAITNATEAMEGRPCYRLRFSTGEKIVADEEHLWIARISGEEERTLTSLEMFNFIKAGEEVAIRGTLPLEAPRAPLSNSPTIMGGAAREAFIHGVSGEESPTVKALEKGIPDEYLLGSVEQRSAFLLGITEGATQGRLHFLGKDEAWVFLSLAASLGANVDMKGGRMVDFELPSQGAEVLISVLSMDKVKSVPVRCIEVDNEDHCYLAGYSLIPTHNSVFAVNCAVAAAQANKSVMFFSLEMEKDEIHDRIFASTTGIAMDNLKKGILTDEERRFLEAQMKEMKDIKLTLDVEPKQTVDTIRARALRQAQSPEGLDFIIVDYLQLIVPTGRFSNRQEQVADISRNMKLLAKQLKVPIMVLVQMKRKSGEEDENSLPKLDDIRESGAIAQDSDIVMLLHREIALDEATPNTLVILAKNRGGQANKTVRCHSNLPCSVFREIPRAKDIENALDDEDFDLEDTPGVESFDDTDLSGVDISGEPDGDVFATDDLDDFDFDL